MKRGTASLSKAAQLKPLLETLRTRAALAQRIEHDPVSLVRRYESAADQEVAGLFCASLAYGRVDLFKPVLTRLLDSFGQSPSMFCSQLPTHRDFDLTRGVGSANTPGPPSGFGPLAQPVRPPDHFFDPFRGLVYRFNLGSDLACLAWAIGDALRAHGSLEALFLSELERTGDIRSALSGFTRWLRERDFTVVRSALGPPRALGHLLPDAARGGASKRLLLYLRWMARGPDEVDLGAWKSLGTRRLLIPVDTHIGRMGRNLGLTRRKDLSWRTAEEITAALRQLNPDDPVSYDFALCHFGMSGQCPPRRCAESCRGCELRPVCQAGTRLVRLTQGAAAVRSAPSAAAGKFTPSAAASVRANVS